MGSFVYPHIHVSEVAKMEQFVGAPWGPASALHEIRDHGIDAFARCTGNFQWIHTDDERCVQESPYGKKIAHGVYLLSLIPGDLLPTSGFTLTGCTVRIIRRIEHVRFPAPAFVGDTVRARSRLLKVEKPESGKGVVLTHQIKVWKWDEHTVRMWVWNDVDIWERMEEKEKPLVTCEMSFQYF